MKTITKVFEVYTIDELEAVNEDGYKKAIEAEREAFADNQLFFCYEDFLHSIKTVGEKLGFVVGDYSIGIYENSYILINTDEYHERTNEEKNATVAEVNRILESEDECYFTGTWTDIYFKDYFKKQHIERVTFNDLHKHYESLVDDMLEDFINDMEKDYDDEGLHYEELLENEVLFLKDGRHYNDGVVA